MIKLPNLKPFSPLINLFIIFTLFCLERKILAVDFHYTACNVPTTCGSQEIKFPFYIPDQQESFCGYPGFELSCRNNKTLILTLPNNDDYTIQDYTRQDYTIQEIFYQNQSLRVSNSIVLDAEKSYCIPPIKNISIPYDRFKLASNQRKLFLLSGCNLTDAEEFSQHKVNCSGQNMDNSVLALFGDDPVLGNASEKCREAVVAPVDVGEEGGVENMLRRGFVMEWVASNCSFCEASGGICGFDKSTYHFNCLCPDRPHAWHCVPKGNRKLALKLGLGIACPTVVLIVLSIFIIWRRTYKQKYGSSSFKKGNTSTTDPEGGNVCFEVPIFSYDELEKATNKFDEKKELGDGGFGTVYHGKLKDGREVAIKRLYEHNYKRVKQFMNEVEILTRLHHKNLVSLYGCTSHHSRELLLVYEFVPNGTVADHLHGDRAKPGSLLWPVRMSIAIETASALAYLHASDIIHRDVKTNNILLDSNFCVKVADFGLSRLFPNDVTHVSTAPQGTPGYVDPEYHQCYQLTEKSDVYSFGVVLVELISSMPAVDISRHRHEINLANLAINKIQRSALDELIDPTLGYKSDEDIRRMTTLVAELAFQCLQKEKEMRPTMDEVLEELKRIQGGDPKQDNVEGQLRTLEVKGEPPPPSPPTYDEAALLKNIRQLRSPDSVIDKWVSSSTTPNNSG
ncbi:hypothetical protein SLEP1_g4290 [Rubroshorea leprosula]|uniref:non-specific serine/threonine protein kinase n=1 Tax=Rubroshorea leprosula TaxID=152421 RepID=A0AAV5HYZ2_9ROSI|nr:hypothetical protein SLEP1_g4290 [Rubroshorea leprosula]